MLAGLHGCIGSTDTSHLVMECCSYRPRKMYLRYKLAHTAQTYNITVNPRRWILNLTKGHPTRFNDTMLVRFDVLANYLNDGELDESDEFTLKDFDEDVEVVEVKYKDFYVLADYG